MYSPERMPRAEKTARTPSIVPYANSDKDAVPHETWADKIKHVERTSEFGPGDRANFPVPSRIGLFGPPGVGKTTCVSNLLAAADPPYDELYVIHGDAQHSTEYDALHPTALLSDVPGIEFWRSLPQTLPGKKKPIRRMVVVDDLEVTRCPKARLEHLGQLFRYVSTHIGLTAVWSYQSLFDTPPIVRKMLSVFILWKPTARSEVSCIENRVGLPPGSLPELFADLCQSYRDSICIDLSHESPAPIRLNLYRKIEGVEGFD